MAVTAAEIQKYLGGINYPAGKQELISKARSNSAPQEVMQVLNSFSNETFNGPTEVEQEFARHK